MLALITLLPCECAALRTTATRRQIAALIGGTTVGLSSQPGWSALPFLGETQNKNLDEAMAPLLNVGKEPLDGYEESQATRAAAIEKIKEEGLLKSTGKDVPAPLIAAIVFGAVAAAASYALDSTPRD